MIGQLSAGEMDQRITIQTVTQGRGASYGEPTETAVDWKKVWAKVIEVGPAGRISGGERYNAHQVSAECTMVFECRYFSGLTATMLVVWDGRTYDILRFPLIGRKAGYLIEGKARVL